MSILAIEPVVPDGFADLKAIGRIEAIAPGPLGDQVFGVVAPGLQCTQVLKFHHGNPFAVVRPKGLEIDKARHGASEFEHPGGDHAVLLFLVAAEPGPK